MVEEDKIFEEAKQMLRDSFDEEPLDFSTLKEGELLTSKGVSVNKYSKEAQNFVRGVLTRRFSEDKDG